MNFNAKWADYARYLPAPNSTFVEFAQRPMDPTLKSRLPIGISAEDINFLDAKSPLFYWPNVLFTAAFAVGRNKETIISKRDRADTFVLGDSGGFSLISGAIASSMSSWREATLDWQEKECDVGIVVDVPTRAIDVPASGYQTFQACLDQTIENMRFAIGRRSRSSLKLLAVYQGRTKAEADKWASAIQAFQPDFEGIAIAGHTRLDIANWIGRLRSLIDQRQFDTVAHIHFLGTAQPRFAVLATALQRALRKHVRGNIDVTFDSSTSFTFVHKFGQIVTGLDAGRKSFAMTTHTMPNRGGEFNPKTPFPYSSPIGTVCTVGDFLPGTDPTKNPSDSVGNNMLSNHSVYAELSAILEANRLADMAQRDGNALIPYGVGLATKLIDRAVAGSDQALNDLRNLMGKSDNKISTTSGDRTDEEVA